MDTTFSLIKVYRENQAYIQKSLISIFPSPTSKNTEKKIQKKPRSNSVSGALRRIDLKTRKRSNTVGKPGKPEIYKKKKVTKRLSQVQMIGTHKELESVRNVARKYNVVIKPTLTDKDIYFLILLSNPSKMKIIMNEMLFESSYKYIAFYEKNLYLTAIRHDKFPEDSVENILKCLILPRLFQFEKGYLLSYFHIGINVSDFRACSLLCDCMDFLKGKGKMRVHTQKQFDKIFLFSSEESLTKENLIYMLIVFIKAQINKKIPLKEDIPEIIEYFRLDKPDLRLEEDSWLYED